MKKIMLIIYFLLCTFVISHASDNPNLFYYGLGDKFELSVIPNKLALQKNTDISKKEFLQSLSLMSSHYIIEWRGENLCIIEEKGTPNISKLKDDLRQKQNDIIILPLYTINKYSEAILLPEIVVKAKSISINESLLTQYGLKLKVDKGIYQIYSVPMESDIIGIANMLYETGEYVFSYPHFQVPAQSFAYIPNDPYFQYQITCHNTGQTLPNGHTGTSDADIDAPDAWAITKGSSNIVVAVFDEGVTSDHPDLPNTRQVRIQGSNLGSGNPDDPSPTDNSNHGNACAGVIAASMNNNQGIAGIAPQCKIMPLRWDNESSDTDMADGIRLAVDSGANIISCSWGYDSQSYSSPAIIAAIVYAIAKNVTVIFATGNTANHMTGNNGFVAFPANLNTPYLITVGASDRYDHIACYSPKSSLIDFVAPSHRAYSSQISGETFEMWTLDMPGFVGYNPTPNNFDNIPTGTILPSTGTNYLAYTGYFGGTSHACPVVAGVVALMLSVNPYLTPADIFDILKVTSDKVGGYTYTNGRCNEMGYGRVNAYAAVREAENRHPIQEADYVCDTTCFYLTNAPDNATFTWTMQQAFSAPGDYNIIQGQGTSSVCVEHFVLPPFPFTSISDSSTSYSVEGRDMIFPPFYINNSISVTVATQDTTYTISKILRYPIGDTPEVSVSDSSYIWNPMQKRTFTVTNCTTEPDSVFHWEVKRDNVLESTHIGRTYMHRPASLGYYTVSVTNTEKECGNQTTSLHYRVRRTLLLTVAANQGVLDVAISEEDSQKGQSPLMEDADYTLELWHNIYGLMKEQKMLSLQEQMDISSLPQGVYVILLKENGNVIAQEKIQF